jgi:hypothetical protein
VPLSQDRAPISFIPNEMRRWNDLVSSSTVVLASVVRSVCASPALVNNQTQNSFDPNVPLATHEQTNIPGLRAR